MDLHVKSKKYNDADVLEVKEDLALKNEIGTKLKVGTYIYDGDDKLIWVEDISSDFSGIVYYFGDDYLSIQIYGNGEIEKETIIDASEGVSKIDFRFLTFSLVDLDDTLRQLVESAISSGGDGVACSQAQWNVIKNHLDKCLYLSYGVYTLIKSTVVNGNQYSFGNDNSQNFGAVIEFSYDTALSELSVYYHEI